MRSLFRLALSLGLLSCLIHVSCESDEGISPKFGDQPPVTGDTSTPVDTSNPIPNGTDPINQETPTDTGQQFNACAGCQGLEGVDILVVVDNSISMGEEQQILATGFYTLINSLVAPVQGWPYAAAANVRVGITSSDLGVQYGGQGASEPQMAQLITGCGDAANPLGDDGMLLAAPPPENAVTVDSYRIKCDPDGAQCPDPTWTCNHNGTAGLCIAPNNAAQGQVACNPINGAWADTTAAAPTDIARNVACMAQLGTDGCGFEQQLQAGVRSLQRNQNFIRPNHLLAVLVVSDEEDCSMSTNGIFYTPEFQGLNINTSCNLPPQNETNNLFNARYFYDSLIAAKGGNASQVLFAAIVGVPPTPVCQGTGDMIQGCLADPQMQYASQEIVDPETNTTYWHFAPACERVVGNTVVTSARPGRRYVQVAQEFGCASYIYSICNEDWSDAMTEIARLIANCLIV